MNIIVNSIPNDEIKLRKGFTGADWWWEKQWQCNYCYLHVRKPDVNNEPCPRCGGEKFVEQDILEVRVASELTDWRERMALAVHEVCEALMCRYNGVTVAQVDEFDAKFKGENEIDINAGDEPDAPYRLEHTYATAIERVLTGVMGVDWKGYDTRLGKL